MSFKIQIQDHAEGCILPVRAQPGARGQGLRGEQNGALKVAVTQVAEKGKANQAIAEVLAEELRLKRWQVELLSGDTNREKRFLIRGVTRDELVERLATAGQR